MATQILVEHFDVERPGDERFTVQLNITGWSDAVSDADEPEVLEIWFDRHEVIGLIQKLQSVLEIKPTSS